MTRPLWTLTEILAATGGRTCGAEADGSLAISGISIDSRSIEAEELFIAIVGEKLDGHDYVAKAGDAGAVAAIVSETFAASVVNAAIPLVAVSDTLKAMEALGRAARDRSRARIVAVTGSVGKTGTKEMMRTSFVTAGHVHAAERSFNNHWGVPLTLARMPSDTDIGVFEIGMNHPGEIRPLVKMVRPHVAIITTVEPVHLGFFSSVEEIADAKAEILEGVEPGGHAILNIDNRFFRRLSERARSLGVEVTSFGEGEGADVRLVGAEIQGDRSTFQVALSEGRRLDATLGAPGRHLVQNALGVIAVADAIGCDPELVAERLINIDVPKGRGARTLLEHPSGGTVLVIDESYNANPASMAAALANLGSVERRRHPRRVAVLGDMLELGDAGPKLHAALANAITAAAVDLVMLCGPLMAHLRDALEAHVETVHKASAEDLRDDLLATIQPGDVVMLKGSLGSRIGPLVEALTTAYRIGPDR